MMTKPTFAESTLQLKARLIAGGSITVGTNLLQQCESGYHTLSRVVKTDNLYSSPWIFIRLGDSSRVRMLVTPERALFELSASEVDADRYDILDSETGNLIAAGLSLEEPLHHCPRQLFYNLFGFCSLGCKFCPLPLAPRLTVKDSLEKMVNDLERVDPQDLDGIGLTSGIPHHLSGNEVAAQMADTVRVLRAVVGTGIPIGVSPMQPSRDALLFLRDAGANEVRLNLEVVNPQLAKVLVPRKDPRRTLASIADAVDIFGRGKTSSNIILGIGETDEDVVSGITELAQLGAIATLYPLDRIAAVRSSGTGRAQRRPPRPHAKRLLLLAQEHKRVLDAHGLDPKSLMTMCPRCAASHIMPGRDL